MKNSNTSADVILIGAGIMSATLGMLLNQLQPSLTIEIFERLDGAAVESSDAWNKWQQKFKKMIPSYGQALHHNEQLCHEVREYTTRVLGLKFVQTV